jgi:hypothetical protein
MRRSRHPVALLALVGVLAVTGCSKKPSEAQCEEFADHFVKLLEESRGKPDARIRKLAHNQRQDLVDACVSEGSVKEVECVLGQASVLDVEANCK